MTFQTISQVAAKMLINAIHLKEKDFPLYKICTDIKSMMNWNFNFEEFKDAVYETPDIKIETLWNLHVLQVLPFDDSFTRFTSEAMNSEFQHEICCICLRDTAEDETLEFIQLGLISYLLNKAFSGAEEEMEKVCLSIIQVFLRELFSLGKDMTVKKTNIFFSIWKCGLIENKTLIEFCIYSLRQFLKNGNVTMMEAFAIQECSKSSDEPFHVKVLIKKIIKSLTPEDVVCIIFESNFEDITNWTNYLVLLETFIRIYDEKSKIILRNNEELIKSALQNLNQNFLKKAIIIGRQTALQSNEPFPIAYKKWFLNHLVDSLHIKHTQSMSFFIQVMSELLPYEKNVGVVKVYLERPLAITSECQSLYNDYIILLKTRIRDLEPETQPEDVISKLLVAYQDTGKVPSYIMEASLMRKHYFLNVFLPVLLTPRILPNFPDLREKFIDELHRIGKIPGVIFQQYKTACDQEKQKLLEN